MNIGEELKSAGVYPTGPVSAWPRERHNKLFMQETGRMAGEPAIKRDTKVKAGFGKMAKGLANVTYQAVKNGKVKKQVREERYEICKACPHFIEDSKRCSECGCFMEAKTWVKADPDLLCPKKKWPR
jgi:hypothetical protein